MTTVVTKLWKCRWASFKLHIIVLNSSVPLTFSILDFQRVEGLEMC